MRTLDDWEMRGRNGGRWHEKSKMRPHGPLSPKSFKTSIHYSIAPDTLSVNITTIMASLQSIPRFILSPRFPLLRLRPQTLALLPTTSLRYASSSNPKTLSEQFRRRQTPVIPQPDKYRPPSHGKRTPRSETTQRSYGPPLTEEDKKRMRTKKYPNMMSPEGTFSHWFLHNKVIHLWITMVCTRFLDSIPTMVYCCQATRRIAYTFFL
jgi:hypothetical protein